MPDLKGEIWIYGIGTTELLKKDGEFYMVVHTRAFTFNLINLKNILS